LSVCLYTLSPAPSALKQTDKAASPWRVPGANLTGEEATRIPAPTFKD